MTYHQWVGGRDISWGWRDVCCKDNMQMGSVPKISFFHGGSSRTMSPGPYSLKRKPELFPFSLIPTPNTQSLILLYVMILPQQNPKYYLSPTHFQHNTVMLLGPSNTCWLLCLNDFTSLPHLFFCFQTKMLLIIDYSLIG